MRRKVAIAAAAAALSVILLLVFWRTPAELVQEQIEAMQGTLQLKREMTLSEESQVKLVRSDLVIGITKSDLDKVVSALPEMLNASKQAKATQVKFKKASLQLGPQFLSVSLSFDAPVGESAVTATLHVSAAIGAMHDGMHWSLFLNGIEVDKVSPQSRLTEPAAKILAARIISLRPLMNAILDEAVNDSPKNSVIVRFDKSGLINENIGDLSSGNVILQPKALDVGMKVRATAIAVSRDGVLMAADVDFMKSSSVADDRPKLPSDLDLVRQASGDLPKRIDAYRKQLSAKIEASHGPEISDILHLETTGASITRSTISRLFASLFPVDGISGTVKLDEPSSEKNDINFTISARDCSTYLGQCEYQNICAGDRCQKKTKTTVRETCKVQCWITAFPAGFFGACDKPCDKIEDIVQDIGGPACDAFRASDKLNGGLLCKSVSNIDKALCDIDANTRRLACDAEQSVRRFYEKNPVATVTTTMKPSVNLIATVHSATWSADLEVMNVSVSASGSGSLEATIGYDRHNYADAVILGPGVSLGAGCAADWNAAISEKVSATLDHANVQFVLSSSETPDGSLRLEFRQAGDQIALVDLSPPPLPALFRNKPSVAINCPLTVIAATVFGVGEAVFTQEQARKVFPLLTGKNYPAKIRDQHFKVDVRPIDICQPVTNECKQPIARLRPKMKTKSVMFLVE